MSIGSIRGYLRIQQAYVFIKNSKYLRIAVLQDDCFKNSPNCYVSYIIDEILMYNNNITIFINIKSGPHQKIIKLGKKA